MGQMSLWGNCAKLLILPISLNCKMQFSTATNKNDYNVTDKYINILMEKFIGVLDGDGYI